MKLPGFPVLLPVSSQVVAQVSVAASGSGNIVATCPSGSVVTGGGFAINPNLAIHNSSAHGNGWLASAQNLSGSAQGLNVYAECLANTKGTIQQVLNQGTLAASGAGQVVANCPSGSVVTGGGFAGNANLTMHSDFASGNGWQVDAKNSSSSSQPLNAYAICLSGTSGSSQQVMNQVSAAAIGVGHALAACPSATFLTGGGFAGNENLFFYSESASGSSWQVYANNNSGSSEPVNSYAICLKLP